MPDLIQLTDSEVDLVSGGYISQYNSSYISQSASASNSGPVTASASGSYSLAVAAGAAAETTALVQQANVVKIRYGYH